MPQLLEAFCGTQVPPRLITYSRKAEDRPGYTGAGDSNGNGPTAKPRDPRRRSQRDSVPSGKGGGGRGVGGGLGESKQQYVRLRNSEEKTSKHPLKMRRNEQRNVSSGSRGGGTVLVRVALLGQLV